MKKVLLLSMPFGALERPALGLSLLKAVLGRSGIACDVRYFTFAFAEYIGPDDYRWINYELPYTAFAGDWAFTSALYGERPAVDASYVEEILRKIWRLDDASVARVLRARSYVGHFLDHCEASVPWEDYALVGFTSTFEQNLASLALARRIKARRPGIAIVFGGANWEGEMGLELHRRFPFVDYACSGESEESFPELARRVLSGGSIPGGGAIPGVVYRAGGESSCVSPPRLIRDLDALPDPDFEDYFRDYSQSAAAAPMVPTLLFETSRGCWWGAKSHCTFCGLNGGTMAFRSKSPGRALEELLRLVDRWRTGLVEAVDNILDMKYFRTFVPGLAEAGRPARMFYEVKANLSRAQVKALAEAGIDRVQPGIESLSDHVLGLMRKGTTALRNVQLMRWCAEYGVEMDWNLIYGFPGETREDYTEMLDLLRSIRFLRAPTAAGPVRLDRFSPYFNDPGSFGLVDVRPLAPYAYLYPFEAESLARVAYYFGYGYAPGADPSGFADEVVAFAADWKRNPEPGSLRSIARADGTLALADTRSDAVIPELVLSGPERSAYDYCDEVRTGPAVARHVRQVYPGVAVSDARVVDFLDAMVSNRLMLRGGDSYLSLAIPAPPLGQLLGLAEGLAPRDWLMPSAICPSAKPLGAGA